MNTIYDFKVSKCLNKSGFEKVMVSSYIISFLEKLENTRNIREIPIVDNLARIKILSTVLIELY